MHEASLHDANVFVTLTYSDEELPENASLDRQAFPLFAKRTRKRLGRFRYFHCGEYGEVTSRPHYHALLFGLDFADKSVWSVRNGLPVWRSDTLESLWPYGQSEIGSVTFESAAYVARYVVKKVTGRQAESHYGGREPEYATMSRRPGIGRGWLEKFSSEVYPSDEVIARGKRAKPPRYYDQILEAEKPKVAEAVRRERRRNRNRSEETPARLHVREVCTTSRLSQFSREVT